MKFSVLLFFIFLFALTFSQSPCDVSVSICEPGVTDPFAFEPGGGAGTDFANGTCATGTGGLGSNYGFITLNITTGGNLNLLIDANTNNGFIDVIAFNIPVGIGPCDAIMNPANEIGCNFATDEDGCVQFGTSFPCTSSVPAPMVSAGDQIMIIVHDWSNVNTDFTLELNTTPGSAATGSPDPTISAPAVVSETDLAFTPSVVNAGGSWSASCGGCIDPATGVFDPAAAGPGNYQIIYDIGVAPCDTSDTVSITVTPDCVIPFSSVINTAYESCFDGSYEVMLNFTDTLDYVIYYNVSGTATSGVDYTPISDSLIIPANTTLGSIDIFPMIDTSIEGTESVVFEFYNPCDSIVYLIDSVQIKEIGSFDVSVNEDTICPSDVVSMTAVLNDVPMADVSYVWTPNNGTIAQPNNSITNATPISTPSVYISTYPFGTCSASDSLTIYIDEFSLDFDTTLISCPGANDGALAVIPTGGVGEITYSWSPVVSVDSSVSNLGPGTYVVTIMDESGLSCGTLLDSVELIEPSGLSFTYDSTNVSCFGLDNGSVKVNDLTPDSSFTADITYNSVVLPQQSFTANAAGSITIGNLPPGVYDPILITNPSTGCNNSFSVIIEEPDTLTVEITTPGNVLCAGGSIDSLTATTVGGVLNYDFLWSTSETTKTIQGITFGTYWTQVTDANGCVVTDTIIVSQPTPIGFTLLRDSVTCFGGNDGLAYIDTLGGGTPPYTYLWDASTGFQTNDTASSLTIGNYTLTVTDFNGCQEQNSIEVYQPLDIILGETHVNVSCFGGSNGSIDLTITNGETPFTYAWTGPSGFTASSEDLTGLEEGTYDLVFTDNASCTKSLSVVIGEPTAIDLTIDSTDVTCKDLDNGSATVSASGGTGLYTYSWSHNPGLNAATAINLSEGTYQVVVSDANGCQDSISISINQPDSLLLSLDAFDDVQCNGGNSGSINVSTSGGTAPYGYQWTNGGGVNEDLTNASTGSYTLTVTDDNGCQNSLTQNISEPSALNIVLVEVNVSCFGANTGSIDATVSGAVSPYTYSWSGPAGFTSSAEDITNLLAGTYVLTVTDSNNCTAIQNVVVTEPAVVTANFIESSVSCFGGNDGSLTVNVSAGGTAPFTYQWDAAANNQIMATATGLIAGNYGVEITDANMCTYNFSSNLTQPDLPVTLTMDSTLISCAGYNDGSAMISVVGGTVPYSYLWNDALGQTTGQASNLSPNTYQVTVTDANNCSETASVTITEPDAIIPSAVADSANCWGDASGSILVAASGGTGNGYAYSIDGGTTFQSNPFFGSLDAGTYDEVLVQDIGSSELCVSMPYTITVFEPAYFYVDVLPSDTTLELEESLLLELDVSAPYSIADVVQINWDPTIGLDCSDCLSPNVLTYEHYTEYTATVGYYGDDAELCLANSSTVIIVENNLELFIPNAFTPGGFDNVNPVFEIYGEGIEYSTMHIYNRWGEKLFESKNQRVAWDGTYQGIMQNPGVYTYFVEVVYLDGKELSKKGSVTLLR